MPEQLTPFGRFRLTGPFWADADSVSQGRVNPDGDARWVGYGFTCNSRVDLFRRQTITIGAITILFLPLLDNTRLYERL